MTSEPESFPLATGISAQIRESVADLVAGRRQRVVELIDADDRRAVEVLV